MRCQAHKGNRTDPCTCPKCPRCGYALDSLACTDSHTFARGGVVRGPQSVVLTAEDFPLQRISVNCTCAGAGCDRCEGVES